MWTLSLRVEVFSVVYLCPVLDPRMQYYEAADWGPALSDLHCQTPCFLRQRYLLFGILYSTLVQVLITPQKLYITVSVNKRGTFCYFFQRGNKQNTGKEVK